MLRLGSFNDYEEKERWVGEFDYIQGEKCSHRRREVEGSASRGFLKKEVD